MKYSELPSVITSLFASGASSSAVTDIPDTQASSGDGRVSWELGYPPETMIARSAGGVPPYGQDANGIGKKLSQYIQALQAGNIPKWTQDFANAIGGYPSGALAADPSTVGVFWVSTADDNTTQPGANGASWQNLFTGYVKKSGDTSTGTQYSSGWFWGGYNAGWGGSTTSGGLRWTVCGVAFGNPGGDASPKYAGNFCVSDVLNDGGANDSGINMRGYDSTGALYNWFFAWNGKVTTPGGVLAFESDLLAYFSAASNSSNTTLTNLQGCNWSSSATNSYVQVTGGGISLAVPTVAYTSKQVSDEATLRKEADAALQNQINTKIECSDGNKLIAFQISSVSYVEGGTYIEFPDDGFSDVPVSVVSTTNADADMDTMTFNWSKSGFYINIPSQTNSQGHPVSIMAVGPA